MSSTGATRRPLRHAALRVCSTLGALTAFFVAVVLAASMARAQDRQPDGDEQVAARAGRIANVQGPLYHASGDSAGPWSQIGLNYPVVQGDNLRVDDDGHAEVDYGGGQFRLAGGTTVHVSRLDERQLALFIASGRVIVRVRVLDAEDGVRIDTPATQVSLVRPGLYRIDVEPGAVRTTLIVREGAAEVATAGGSEAVLPGQTAVLSGTKNVTADIRNGGGIDGFDAWSAARDRVYEGPRQEAYVSRQMVGEADLDRYGTWRVFAPYGAVWFPTVNPEWAPYRFGRWTWLPGFGYAWVDDAAWGYAPFHYGRWIHTGGQWGWCPGAFVARPAWAPALVAWYGGRRWSYSSSLGAPVVGWVPLGWGEPFVPSWRGCTARCHFRYNHPYGVNEAVRGTMPPTHFANWTAPGGLTAMRGAAIAAGKPVEQNRVPIAASTAFTAALVTSPPARPVRPTRSASPAVAPERAQQPSFQPLPQVAAPISRVGPAAPQSTPAAPNVAPAIPRVVPRLPQVAPTAPQGAPTMPRTAAPIPRVAPSPPQLTPAPTPPLTPVPPPGTVPRPAGTSVAPPPALPPSASSPAAERAAVRAPPPRPGERPNQGP